MYKRQLLNLMPLKEDTELQILRSLSNTPLQVDVTFVRMTDVYKRQELTGFMNFRSGKRFLMKIRENVCTKSRKIQEQYVKKRK